MSSDPNSVTGKISHGVHHFFSDPFNMVPDQGNPTAPPPPPTPGAATMTALGNQLQTETQQRGMASLVTGGEGIAEEPETESAGTSLLGAT